MKSFLILLLAVPAAAQSDLWLEEVEGKEALAWVGERNAESTAEFARDPRAKDVEAELRAIFTAKDRIPTPSWQAGRVVNFWQDEANVKGLWRRATLAEYAKERPAWEVLLDVDRLSAQEKESWVYKGADCLAPQERRCLLSLSRGGKDAVEIREFDAEEKRFLPDGFRLPEAKSDLAWVDADTVLVGTDFGPGSMTDSGYPRVAKLWRRGTPLAEAKTVFEGKAADTGVWGWAVVRPDARAAFITRSITRYESEHYWLRPGGGLTRLPLPADARLQGLFAGRLLALLRSEWKTAAGSFPAGALVALPFSDASGPGPESALELVAAPAERRSIEAVSIASSTLYLSWLDNVKGRLERLRPGAAGWTSEAVALPDNGSAYVVAADAFDDRVFVSYEGFLTPPTLYLIDGGAPRPLKSLPARFDASGLAVEQAEAVSADGTKVPYFLLRPKSAKADGSLPVILYGYGGFESSETPEYRAPAGKAWLARGGGYAVANIRGGGEFGPAWHKAALKENRQRAYDDFIAVGTDLVRRKITSPRRLGIYGGSNGGLLVGAVAVQRPDLFTGVACAVPLLDMLRYHKLLAGASWMGEYGDPEDPAMAAAIARYSPYQNVKAGAKYPRIYFYTSTKDDRVHPGHARRMVHKMTELGHRVLYYENTEGGHSAAADLEQRIRLWTYHYLYFLNALF
ncbi:MAG: S9 family peptidase [Elusimicrobia bacterium]|nr:S9 family peptidase [Elusimicrobiota bacterium]